MSDDGVLQFQPAPDEDAGLASRLGNAYDAFPPAPEAQVERCRQYVLANAGTGKPQVFTDAFTVRRRRWWWGGAAAAALVIVATFRPVRLNERGTEPETAGAPGASAVPAGRVTLVDGGYAVRFDLRLPNNARVVSLVGDFNGWDTNANAMTRRTRDGSWTVEVPLSPGMHTYAFVVDGQRWLVDPLAPQVPDAGFGPANAVVVETP